MPSGSHNRVSVTDALKRRELLEEFLWWYFDGFLIPLLKVGLFCAKNKTKNSLVEDADNVLHNGFFSV
jgi:hypothetical protein